MRLTILIAAASLNVAAGHQAVAGILCRTMSTLRLSTVTQEAQIPAFNQREGIADERDDGGSQRGCLPGFRRHATFTEKDDADLSIARARGAPVGGLHHQPEPLTLVGGHAGVPRDRARLQRLPESLDRFDPTQQVVVEWKQDGHGPGVDAPRHVEKRNGAIPAEGAIAPFLCVRLRRQINRSGPRRGWPETWDLAQKYGARIGVR